MAEKGNYRIGLVQMACSPDPDANLEKAAEQVREAARQGAKIVCLPELFRTQYFCQREDPALFDLAEPIPGPSTERLASAAREEGVVVVASLFERRAAGLYHNTAAIVDSDGALAGIYRKMHIPDDPLYYEKFYFAPGDLGFRAFDTSVGRIGTLFVGISGIRRPLVLPRLREPICSSIQQPSAGTLRKSSNKAPRNTRPGRRSRGPTPSPMGSMSPPSTVWGWSTETSAEIGPAARGSSSGADPSLRTPLAA